ncbi:AtpZ/AtpI family protein [Flavobacteriaceae bacterium AU392]|nr:AtpZ/AtpI family protein [Flavobacteriaceae bacterium]RKM84894.1 AtpZ/AtpI family protein [Flavobacteriaceae bacterium AU392]
MADQNPKKEQGQLKNWVIFSGIGLQMGLVIFLGNILGSWMDKKLRTSFLEETITLVAVFSAMFMIVYRVNKFNNK